MSRVFSISLNDLTFAKLGELQKRYPDMSRNAMINHIINVVHLGEFNKLEQIEEQLKLYASILEGKK
jgi:hypothetical protein